MNNYNLNFGTKTVNNNPSLNLTLFMIFNLGVVVLYLIIPYVQRKELPSSNMSLKNSHPNVFLVLCTSSEIHVSVLLIFSWRSVHVAWFMFKYWWYNSNLSFEHIEGHKLKMTQILVLELFIYLFIYFSFPLHAKKAWLRQGTKSVNGLDFLLHIWNK